MKTRSSKTKSSRIWCILVDHEFQFQKQIGDHFSVRTSSKDDIDDLRDKVKVKVHPCLTHVSSVDLTVWKTKGEMIINKAEVEERLVEILGNIDVDNEDTIEKLRPGEQVADLGLTDDQVLLVQLPGTSRISTVVRCVLRQAIAVTSNKDSPLEDPIKVDRKYEDLFLRANTKGLFTEDDIDLNDIKRAHEVPEFVRQHEEMLGRKRKLGDDVGHFRILCFRLLTVRTDSCNS